LGGVNSKFPRGTHAGGEGKESFFFGKSRTDSATENKVIKERCFLSRSEGMEAS